MKINKRLQIADQPIELVEEEVNLAMNWSGKCRFMVQSKKPLFGRVNYQAGYAHRENLINVFKGAVDSCIEVTPGKWQVIATEYTSVLEDNLPLALRHVDLAAVLAQITAVAGIEFVIPDQPYAKTKIPYFYHVGSGLQALATIGKAFSIPDYYWQQQGDGKCFVGSYAHSWAQGKTLEVLPNQVQRIDGQHIQLPFLPAVRPGVTVNGQRITEVQHKGSYTLVRW